MKNVRIYDNGGKTLDRYTAVYMHLIENKNAKLFSARGMSENPFHPQGFGCWTSAQPGKHLGKRIEFEELPKDCQQLVMDDIAEDIFNELYDMVNLEFKMSKPVDKQIQSFMKRLGLKKGLFLRREHDGVSEVSWLLEKMIGERLGLGKALR